MYRNRLLGQHSIFGTIKVLNLKSIHVSLLALFTPIWSLKSNELNYSHSQPRVFSFLFFFLSFPFTIGQPVAVKAQTAAAVINREMSVPDNEADVGKGTLHSTESRYASVRSKCFRNRHVLTCNTSDVWTLFMYESMFRLSNYMTMFSRTRLAVSCVKN